jgi:hypothetical protein
VVPEKRERSWFRNEREDPGSGMRQNRAEQNKARIRKHQA